VHVGTQRTKIPLKWGAETTSYRPRPSLRMRSTHWFPSRPYSPTAAGDR